MFTHTARRSRLSPPSVGMLHCCGCCWWCHLFYLLCLLGIDHGWQGMHNDAHISVYIDSPDNSGGVEHGTRFLCGILIIPPIFLFYFFYFSFVLFEVPPPSLLRPHFFFLSKKKKRSSPFVCNHSTPTPHPSLVLTAYTLIKCYAIVGPIRYSIVLTSPKERKGKEWRVAKWRRGSSTHRARSID